VKPRGWLQLGDSCHRSDSSWRISGRFLTEVPNEPTASDRTDPAPNTQKKPISPTLQNRISKLQKEIAEMKSLRIAISLGLLAIATVALAQTSAQKSFDQLKNLTGS
jgi:hypothetical protein